jgi:hypothetical protein
MGLRKKVIQPRGYVRFGSNFLFRPSLVILKILRGQNFTKLDKGFRLVYKLLYLVVEKFWSIFAHKGGPLPKKSRNFDSQPDITIYTPCYGRSLIHPILLWPFTIKIWILRILG